MKLNFMSCRRASELAAKQCITALSRGERIWLGMHLLACAACRKIGLQISAIEQTLRLLQEPDATHEATGGPQLSDESRRRIQSVLADRT